MNDIDAAVAFLREKGFECVTFLPEWNGLFGIDRMTQSSFFFPAGMSLEHAEKMIAESRRAFAVNTSGEANQDSQRIRVAARAALQ